MNNIYIGADFLMTKESEQLNNIQWMFDFIARPIGVATNQVGKIKKFAPDAVEGFQREEFFSLSSDVPSLDKVQMQFFYDEKSISEESLEYLKNFLKEGDIFVAYELSEQTRIILDSIGVTYVDMWLHQVRFMDDVLFGFKSNNNEIQKKLWSFNVDKELMYVYANQLKVQAYKGFKRVKAPIKPNSAVFIGQTLQDKAIYKDGKMLDLTDFKEKFAQLCKDYSHVYYSRHPFVREGDEHIISFVKKFRNASVIGKELPAYSLLASENVKKVCSISSSVAIEAQFFDKEVDLYHRPVIDIEKEYSSVLHSYLYSNFWSSVLSPMIDTNKNVSTQEMFSKKDKIRYSLNFIWSYREIDPLMALRETVGTLFNRGKGGASVGKPKLNHGMQFGAFAGLADSTKVISFDIFDTLITRHWCSPTEVFTFMEKEVNDLSGGRVDNFRQMRIFSQQEAMKKAQENGVQDITLDEIYGFMASHFDLEQSLVDKIKSLEIEKEVKSIRPRESGLEKFEYCLSKGYLVVLVSDMYLSKDVINRMLDKAGIKGYYKFYLSSEIKLRKHEGDLFEFVMNDLKIRESEMVHVGDNPKGDIESANRLGIKTVHTPRACSLLEKNGATSKGINKFFIDHRNESSSLIISLITDRFFDSVETVEKDSLFNNDPFQFGYMAYGPFMYSFTQWIHEQAKKNGIKKLFFLSRDGRLMLDSYNELFKDHSDKIEAEYLYSSRKVTKLSSVDSLNKVWKVVRSPIYATTLAKWLKNNFDIDKSDIDVAIAHEHGFENLDQSIGNKTDRDALYGFCSAIADVIFQKSKKNKECYISYLRGSGVDSPDAAIVDIGYAGSMQKFFHDYLDNKVFGIYLATFESFARNLDVRHATGYLSNHCLDKDKTKTICTHRFLHESLMCAPEESFVKIENQDGSMAPVFKENKSDEVRRGFVSLSHAGATSFIKEMRGVVEDLGVDYHVTSKVATHVMDTFFKFPAKKDVGLLHGIVFEDSYGPDQIRYLIPPKDSMKSVKSNQVIWENGFKAATFSPPSKDLKVKNKDNPKGATLTLRMESWLFRSFVKNERKLNKYVNRRQEFFEDSKVKTIQLYWSFVGRKVRLN